MENKKVVLAYSGGLDTSIILKWLIDEGYEVVCYVADVGQKEDFEAVKKKALSCGAIKAVVKDCKKEFVTDYIFKSIQANALYESRYLMGTSLARPVIAKHQMEVAKAEGAAYVAHGATGKGNDQVRFELTYLAIDPKIKIISPWKNAKFLSQFKGRPDMIAYAEKHGIPVKATAAKPYSTDANLMHISYESGVLEDPATPPNEDMFEWTVSPQKAPDKTTSLEIQFKDGLPIKVTNLDDHTVKTEPLELFSYLNDLGAANGIGRIDIVENRFVGIKSRGVYETPGATILRAAHLDLEGVAMDREVMRLRDTFAIRFADLCYNGFWFSPEMDFIHAAIDKSQELIDGWVRLTLYKGNVTITGRYSPSSLYNQELSSMDVEGGFNQQDSTGFIKINAIRLMADTAIKKKAGKS